MDSLYDECQTRIIYPFARTKRRKSECHGTGESTWSIVPQGHMLVAVNHDLDQHCDVSRKMQSMRLFVDLFPYPGDGYIGFLFSVFCYGFVFKNCCGCAERISGG